ncbi:hypothetical protein ABVT39_007637 [Epinephelus coioides]
MLLLILFAGCLASCAAQTTSFPSLVTEAPFSEPIQATSVQPASDPADNVVAILLTAVQSYHELNETTVGPVLHQLYTMIEQLRPDLNFSLSVKNITRV